MQGYQQRLIIFTLFITVAYGKLLIGYFDAKAPTTLIEPHSTIYDTHIELWTTLTGCPNSKCSCTVNSPQLADDSYLVTFLATQNHTGYVMISDLKPNTNYSLTLACMDEDSHPSLTIQRKTDYGRPSAPKGIRSELVANKLKITWLPVTPPESFTHYKLTIDTTYEDIGKDKTSYEMEEKYADGVKHKIRIQACYKNFQNHILCSNSGDDETTFLISTVAPPVITTSANSPAVTPIPTVAATTQQTATPMPVASTTIKSLGVHSYSVSVLMIFLSLFFLS
ncbi:unnamed protein product [Rotaria magnacalcarata]|uniref:Fibronectin type-III domain-containing protein n=1 Tax=Rotaria magnacalcarata TaxID=392030 RepID=A0A816WAJ5_9BILA|nr:unnamed protein product [Rotaria magnacalcarata]CAF3880664.1 unnamed protein product [Rotaria magnacalcarata]